MQYLEDWTVIESRSKPRKVPVKKEIQHILRRKIIIKGQNPRWRQGVLESRRNMDELA